MFKTIDQVKLDAANKALSLFAKDTTIGYQLGCGRVKRGAGFYVSWTLSGKTITRRWQAHKGSFYATWNQIWPHGGTCMTALAQLIFWLRDEPVLPIATWKYWESDTIMLGKGFAQILLDAGYPNPVQCIKCEKEIQSGNLDWYTIDRKSGPGCRQCEKNELVIV